MITLMVAGSQIEVYDLELSDETLKDVIEHRIKAYLRTFGFEDNDGSMAKGLREILTIDVTNELIQAKAAQSELAVQRALAEAIVQQKASDEADAATAQEEARVAAEKAAADKRNEFVGPECARYKCERLTQCSLNVFCSPVCSRLQYCFDLAFKAKIEAVDKALAIKIAALERMPPAALKAMGDKAIASTRSRSEEEKSALIQIVFQNEIWRELEARETPDKTPKNVCASWIYTGSCQHGENCSEGHPHWNVCTHVPQSPASTRSSDEVQIARAAFQKQQQDDHLAAQVKGETRFCDHTCTLGQACCNAKGIPKGTCKHYKDHSPDMLHMCEPCINFAGSTIDHAETVQAPDTAPSSSSGPSSGSANGNTSGTEAAPVTQQTKVVRR